MSHIFIPHAKIKRTKTLIKNYVWKRKTVKDCYKILEYLGFSFREIKNKIDLFYIYIYILNIYGFNLKHNFHYFLIFNFIV